MFINLFTISFLLHTSLISFIFQFATNVQMLWQQKKIGFLKFSTLKPPKLTLHLQDPLIPPALSSASTHITTSDRTEEELRQECSKSVNERGTPGAGPL